MKTIFLHIGLFFTLICIIMLSKAQKFRNDYMWAQSFKTYYRLHDLSTVWHQARQICEAEGTSLLVPSNLEEMENLKLLVSNMKAHYGAIFLGLHDQFAIGHFVNLKGKPIKETIAHYLWGEGLPDNHDYDEHCVVMTREGLLDDRPCDHIYPFVCKIMSDETKYNKECDNHDQAYKLYPTINKCYNYHDEPLSWHDAYMVCKLEEGDLAIINSQEEAVIITKLLGDHLNSDAPNPNIVLLGFSDLLFPFQYRTIYGKTLEEAGYSSWSPTREEVKVNESKHCGAISRTGFLLMVSCDEPAMFVCQKHMDNSTADTGKAENTSPTPPSSDKPPAQARSGPEPTMYELDDSSPTDFT